MNDAPVTFTVYGTPKPQGSKRHVGGGVLIESGGQALRDWRTDMTLAVRRVMDARMPLDGPVHVAVTFTLPKPKSAKRGAHATKRPDLDKLLRALLDACSAGGCWHDDSQVVGVHATKTYPTEAMPLPGCVVVVRPIHTLSNADQTGTAA